MSNMKPAVFIVGHERSGTSLLRALLTSHGGFALPPNDADLLHLLEQNSSHGMLEREKISQIQKDRKLSYWNIDWDSIEKEIPEQGLNIKKLFQIIQDQYWSRYSNLRRAVKRPRYEYKIDVIKEVYPDALIIAIVRDPRAVLASKKYYRDSADKSWKTFGFIYNRLLTSLNRWRLSLAAIKRAHTVYGPESVFIVHYEDLVTSPESTITKLFAFLSEPYDRDKIYRGISEEFNSNSTFAEATSEQTIFKQDSITRWKTKLEATEQYIVDHAIGDKLKTEEYDLSNAHATNGTKIIGFFNLQLFKLLVFR